MHAWRNCKGLWSLLSYPLLVATTCFNPAEGPQTPQTASRSAECQAAELAYVPTYWRWIYAYMTGHRSSTSLWLSDSSTCDSSVNDSYCFRLFSVDTSPSTYFSPFQSRTLPRSTRTMTDSGQLRSSISLLGNHAEFLLSRSTSALNTLQASLALWFLLEEKETSTNRQNSKVSTLDRRSVMQSASTCLCSGAPRPVGDLAGAATSLATESTGAVLIPSQMSEIAGHVFFSFTCICLLQKCNIIPQCCKEKHPFNAWNTLSPELLELVGSRITFFLPKLFFFT